MELQPLIDSALRVIFFDNDTENGQHPKPFHDLLTSADLDIAFAEAEACPRVDLDIHLKRVESALARRDSPGTYEFVDTAQAVNQLRRSYRAFFWTRSRIYSIYGQAI